MMNRRILSFLFGLALIALAGVVLRAQTHPTSELAAATQAVAAATQAAAAATQAAAATTQAINVPPDASEDEAKGIIDQWYETRFGKIVSGKKQLTLQDVKSVEFWIENIRDLVVTVLAFVPRFIGTLVFLFVFWLIYRGIRKLAVGNLKKQEVDSSIRDLLGGLIKWAIMGFGVVIACNQLGIPIVAMLTGVSIIGLAVGFAAQETLANFIAGIVIFLDKPFKVGDWIQIGDEQGAVRRITFRSTRFTNLDNDVVIIPNTKILSEQIINKSTNDYTRVNVPIGIAYKESIDRAREVLLAAVSKDERILNKPEPEVVVRACAASSVDLMLHFFVREERYQDAMVWEYIEVAKKALDAAGIEIPFPHMQLLLEDTPAVGRLAGKSNEKNGN